MGEDGDPDATRGCDGSGSGSSDGESTQHVPTSDAGATRPLQTDGEQVPPSEYGSIPPLSRYGQQQRGGWQHGQPGQPGQYGGQQDGYGSGGYGGPGQPGGPGGGQGGARGGTNGLALGALISSVLGFLGLTAVAGIILGVVSLGQLKRTGQRGRGLAVAAIGIGALWILIGVVGVPAYLGTRDQTSTAAAPTTATTSETTAPTDDPSSPTPTGTATGTGTTEPTTVDVSLEVGECTDDAEILDSGEITEDSVVDCGQPHVAEAYAAFEPAQGAFPGEDEVVRQADEGCTREFETFVGLGYNESALEVLYYYPNAVSWDLDRTVVCVVTDPAGEVTGSLRGAAR